MAFTIKRELKPFMAPNHVVESRTLGNGPSYPIADVDEQTLSDLCDQFRRDVFKKAGKTDPASLIYDDIVSG